MSETVFAPPSNGTAEPQAQPSGRDSRGRFTAGNREGHGNPFARQVAELRRSFLYTVTHEEMAELVKSLMHRAKCGDMAAAKLVLSYTLGKPAESVDPDRLDFDEWSILSESPRIMNECPKLVNVPPAGLYVSLVRCMQQIMGEKTAGGLAEALADRVKYPDAASMAARVAAGQSKPMQVNDCQAGDESPSNNGGGGAEMRVDAPSTNGGVGPEAKAGPPSPDGLDGAAQTQKSPSTNGRNGPAGNAQTPSGNGLDRNRASNRPPSGNGVHGHRVRASSNNATLQNRIKRRRRKGKRHGRG